MSNSTQSFKIDRLIYHVFRVSGPPHTEAHWEAVSDQPDRFEPLDLAGLGLRGSLNQPLIIGGSGEGGRSKRKLHLYVPKDTLKAGSSYMFRAVASTDRSGQKAEATFVVDTRPAPTDQGVITVSSNFTQPF